MSGKRPSAQNGSTKVKWDGYRTIAVKKSRLGDGVGLFRSEALVPAKNGEEQHSSNNRQARNDKRQHEQPECSSLQHGKVLQRRSKAAEGSTPLF
jgi:hypothetical protein